MKYSVSSIGSLLMLVLLFLGHGCFDAFAQNRAHGIRSYRIHSPFQADSTTVRVLLPDNYDVDRLFRVLYVLPVKENNDHKYGDGLEEIRKYDFHNRHELICVAPEFTTLPWYVNHPSDSSRQDEDHFLQTVLPFIEDHFSAMPTKEGRLLIGFSKSGWGAFTLLLRHPLVFEKAAGWDIGARVDLGPMDKRTRHERILEIFGGATNFEKYRISTLLKTQGDLLGPEERLFYYNTGGVRASAGLEMHRLMLALEIPHRYLFETKRKHRWNSGWIPQAIKFLVED